MILADTSLWTSFLKKEQPYFNKMREKLETGAIVSIEPVFGELLQGSRNERERQIIQAYWESVPHIPVQNLFFTAGVMAGEKKLYSRGIGLFDAILIEAAEKINAQIWTTDKKLKRVLPRHLIYDN